MEESRAYIIRIMEMRDYARTKLAMDRASSDQQMPSGPMADLVGEISDDIYIGELEDAVAYWKRRRNRHEIGAATRRLETVKAKVEKVRRERRAKRRRG